MAPLLAQGKPGSRCGDRARRKWQYGPRLGRIDAGSSANASRVDPMQTLRVE
jgi:hypothetical protein